MCAELVGRALRFFVEVAAEPLLRLGGAIYQQPLVHDVFMCEHEAILMTYATQDEADFELGRFRCPISVQAKWLNVESLAELQVGGGFCHYAAHEMQRQKQRRLTACVGAVHDGATRNMGRILQSGWGQMRGG